MVDGDGNLSTNPAETSEVWKRHHEKVYSATHVPRDQLYDELTQQHENDGPGLFVTCVECMSGNKCSKSKFSIGQVAQQISLLATGKGMVKDVIPAELLKAVPRRQP